MSEPRHPPSPCVGICRLTDDRSHCVGCLRTLDEIAGWGRLSAAEKTAVVERVERLRSRSEPVGPG